MPGKGLAESIQEAEARGASGSEIDTIEREWLEAHPLITFNEGPFSVFSCRREKST